jgi:hypothetical protein
MANVILKEILATTDFSSPVAAIKVRLHHNY